MIVNPKKIQALIMSCDKKNKYTSNINDSHIPFEDSDILSCVEIDNKLNFKKHISKHISFCRKTCS